MIYIHVSSNNIRSNSLSVNCFLLCRLKDLYVVPAQNYIQKYDNAVKRVRLVCNNFCVPSIMHKLNV